jgi:FkbM family methyltransferase
VLKYGRGTVVQVGANDGVMSDPVRGTVLNLGLPALFVEPLPDLFERLKKNYAGHSQVTFVNAAVSTRSGEADIFRISPAATHLPDWTQGLASFDKSVLLKHQNWPGVGANFADLIEQVQVPVVTMRQLLDDHPSADPVLVLQVDTEGHDYQVVRSAVDAGCLPPLINYEHKHLSLSDQEACRGLLAGHGYAFQSTVVDTLAFRGA